MSEHAQIAPSSLERTVGCPGWIKQASIVPPLPESDEEREGTAAHWVALWFALSAQNKETVAAFPLHAPNGVEITDDMIDGALEYVEALEGIPGMAETRVDIPRIHPTECWGTPDFFQWNPVSRVLSVVDYKFGHRFVEVWENWQLVAYAAGVMDMLRLNDVDVVLRLAVVQPRSYHPDGVTREWKVDATKIRAMVNTAFNAAHAALGPNPPTQSGPWCGDCPARAHCPTFQKTVGFILDWAAHADPMLHSPQDIGVELRFVEAARERLKARATGLAAQAEALIRAGKMVPHFMLESGQTRLKWHENVKPEEVDALAKLMTGKSALKPPTLMTPTQVVKSKALDATVMSAYASRPPGAMKLVPDTTTKAKKVFQR